jgi:hypothetical protein
MIGYVFAEEQRQRWVYDEMFSPSESTLDVYQTFRTSMEEFTSSFNKYTAMRYVEHPSTWDPFITKEPTVLSNAEVLLYI